MKKLVVLLCLLVFLTISIPTSLAETQTVRKRDDIVKPSSAKTSAWSCDYTCDAGLLMGFGFWEFIWKDINDVENNDIVEGGLSRNAIKGKAMTWKVHGKGINRKLRILKRNVRSLKTRVAALEARMP